MVARSNYPPNIISALEKKGIGIYELAKRTGISCPTLRKILLQEPRGHTSSDVFRESAEQRIADELGISIATTKKKAER